MELNVQTLYELGVNEYTLFDEVKNRLVNDEMIYGVLRQYTTSQLLNCIENNFNYTEEEIARGYCEVKSEIGATYLKRVEYDTYIETDYQLYLKAKQDGYEFFERLKVDCDHPHWQLYLKTPLNASILQAYNLL